jgi:hypothetical protein
MYPALLRRAIRGTRWPLQSLCEPPPHSTEDDAEGEEEDYETAMKKLSEKAGDL